MGERGDSTDKAETEGLKLVCDVMVDYLNQSRKPTRAKHTAIFLQRDGILLSMPSAGSTSHYFLN
jgi:hypothetical protein